MPTEQEWEKAARGGGEDRREYPWGDQFDKEKCNSTEAGLKRTTPVTLYPNGVSPYGCYDMAGNVCEWCVDWYHDTRDLRVGRGGSWDDYPDFLLVSYRAKAVASFRDSNIGFRLTQDIL